MISNLKCYRISQKKAIFVNKWNRNRIELKKLWSFYLRDEEKIVAKKWKKKRKESKSWKKEFKL